MVIRLDEWLSSNDLALLRLHGLKGHSTSNSFVSQRAAAKLHSPLPLLASIECDIMNSTQRHIDSSTSRELTPTTFDSSGERPQLPTSVVSYRVSTRDMYYTHNVGVLQQDQQD